MTDHWRTDAEFISALSGKIEKKVKALYKKS